MSHISSGKMEEKKKVAILMVSHLKKELKSENFPEKSVEGMEIAIQCLKSAYSINPFESDKVDVQLEDIIKGYQNAERKPNNESEIIINQLQLHYKRLAEDHKQHGNEFMKNHDYEKAFDMYSISIKLDSTNPIYYCNRAAAYNALGKYNDAIKDCEKAIDLDSTYCKAYFRLGLAFSNLKDYQKAVSCYKKACELDPQNKSCQRNYQLTLSILQGMSGQHQQHQQQQQPQQPHNESTADFNSVVDDIVEDLGDLFRFMQPGQGAVINLPTHISSLLNTLKRQNQNPQNEGQPPPQN